MELNLNLTRRAVVLGVATLVAVGGAVAVGLSGDSAAPAASAGTGKPAPALVGETTPLAPDAFPGITVQGVGKVTGTPDTLVLTLSITKSAGDVSSAMNGMAGTMTAVQNSLKSSHVAEADMKTSGLGVSPQYDYSSNKRTLTGYEATENLTVTLRDTKTAGATISAAAAAGGDATQISGLSTDLQNDSGPLNQARDAAFNDAKAKAAQYAKSAGRSLGAVVRVEENVSTQPSPTGMNVPAAAGDKAVASVPIQMGSTDVTVQVTVVFSFG
ncbi:SIMPL domain-containing protein [Catenulispora subtropica]|uniref:SIMPL domain-containing protein n=1 Tax=Catenulispora subtropica TaxID=450798 RepID=A0ABP5CF46_9ACTN